MNSSCHKMTCSALTNRKRWAISDATIVNRASSSPTQRDQSRTSLSTEQGAQPRNPPRKSAILRRRGSGRLLPFRSRARQSTAFRS